MTRCSHLLVHGLSTSTLTVHGVFVLSLLAWHLFYFLLWPFDCLVLGYCFAYETSATRYWQLAHVMKRHVSERYSEWKAIGKYCVGTNAFRLIMIECTRSVGWTKKKENGTGFGVTYQNKIKMVIED